MGNLSTLLSQQLSHNPFFSGGAVLMAFGFLAASARNVVGILVQHLRERLILSVEVTNRDDAYYWFKQWIHEHPDNLRIRSLLLTTRADGTQNEGLRDLNVFLTPAPGLHFLTYRGRLVFLSVIREDQKSNGRSDLVTKFVFNVFLGKRSLLNDLVLDIKRCYDRSLRNKIRIYAHDRHFWQAVGAREPRDSSTLFLESNMLARLEADIRHFKDSEGWYSSVGVPWKRGYLLYGEPGNGKTSVVMTLAGMFGADVYCLNLSDSSLNDGDLLTQISEVPPGSFVLIEEVDIVSPGRNAEAQKSFPVTLAGLLNALDGVLSPTGVVTFMTTNHKDKLDPALIRPGRADVHLHVGNAEPDQVASMFLKFYPYANLKDAERMANKVPAGLISMAALQDHFLSHTNDPEGSIASAHQLRPEKVTSMTGWSRHDEIPNLAQSL